MDENDWLADHFEAHRGHLIGVAYRMLGSLGEADDAVQESWLRISRSGASGVENLGGWLTTIVARVSLDMLRSRKTRREEPLDQAVMGSAVANADGADPEQEALLADSVGLALLVVLETLTPAERVAFVLHDMFAVPFGEIATIVGRSPDAARKLASRARRRVHGAGERRGEDEAKGEQENAGVDARPDRLRQREIVDAFLAASRGGDLAALIALLDPEVVLRADEAAVQTGAESEVVGAQAVAGTFAGRARAARLALVGGAAGAVWAPGGTPRVVFAFTVEDDKIVAIDLLADPVRLQRLDLQILDP